MNNIKPLFSILTGFVLFFSAGITFAEESKILNDQYYISKIKNSKIGYVHLLQKEKETENKKLIETSRHSELKFNRLGFIIKMTYDMVFVEDDSGNPVSFSTNMVSLGENINIQGNFISPDIISIVSEINGVKKTDEIKLDKKILFPYAIQKLFKKNLNSEKITYSTIDTQTDFRILNITSEKVGT